LPVAQVRERIVAEIRGERTRKAAEAAADAMVAKLNAGTPIAQVAAEHGLVAIDLPIVPRGAPMPAREATQAYFSVPAPAPGKVSPGKARLQQDGSYVVFVVTKVTPGDPSRATPAERETLQRQLAQAGGTDDARAFIATMRRAMMIDVAEDRL
jgi:peptidyl-prolyl cis-trans isomerase D